MWIKYQVGVRAGRIADVDESLARHFIANGTAVVVDPPVNVEPEPESEEASAAGPVEDELHEPEPESDVEKPRRRRGRRPRGA